MGYLRYVAVGDSQTEGLLDGDEHTGYRGWADRLAELLAVHHPRGSSTPTSPSAATAPATSGRCSSTPRWRCGPTWSP